MKFSGIHFPRRFAPAYGPHYGVAAQACLRGMGLTYVVSFWSLAAQVVALSGPGGLLPATEIQQYLKELHGSMAPLLMPGPGWLTTHPLFLLALTGAGAVAGLCLLYGFFPWLAALISWMSWVSLIQICSPWTGAGDLLTAEIGLLLLFLISPRARSYPPPSKMGSQITGILLLNALLFKVLFSSGLAKLGFGDPNWENATAFFHFFETQPLPVAAAWYAHQLPATVLKNAVWGLMFVELILPFYVFLPRTFRNILAGGVVIQSLLFLVTGQNGFTPLLMLILAQCLVDDVSWRRLLPARHGPAAAISLYQPRRFSVATLCLLLPLFISQVYLQAPGKVFFPWRWVENVLSRVQSSNRYALMSEVKAQRYELSVQGSMDGRSWVEYRFRLKPTDPRSLPMMTALHLPRLDLAFTSLAQAIGEEASTPPPVWLLRLTNQLLQNDPGILSLFPGNPFPQTPPKYLRLVLYEYQFADPVTRREQQVWWEREFNGFYGPVFTLEAPHPPLADLPE